MWQRVRLIAGDKRHLGKLAWANPDTIEECLVDRIKNGRVVVAGFQRVVNINVYAPAPLEHVLLAPPLIILEFLSEFSESPPLIEYEQFIAGDV